MLDLFGETEKPLTGEVYTGPEPGLLDLFKQGAMAVPRGVLRLASAAAMTVAPVFPSEDEATFAAKRGRPLSESRGFPSQEDFYRFTEQRIDPAINYLTPDPESQDTAGKIVSALFELPGQLIAGPAGIIATPSMTVGKELIEQGVDSTTATLAAAATGAAMAAAIKIPASGKTLKQTLGLIAANPVVGAAQDFGTSELLKLRGYEDQAQMFDPFDPAARSIDLVLGGFFGGLAEYGRWRNTRAPQEVVDAIDTVETVKQQTSLSPFVAQYSNEHRSAIATAMQNLAEGKPVDVARQIETTRPKAPEPSYTAERFKTEVKEVFGLSADHADAALALVAARAKVAGENVDAYINKRIAGVTRDLPAEEALLYQYPNVSREDALAAKSMVIERMAKVEPDSEASMRLEIMLEQYNSIIAGTASYADYQPAALFQGRELVQPFYSKVLAEVQGLTQEKWNGEQLLGKLRKTPGVKGEELAWTGLDEFLAGKKSVTRQEVQGFLEENQVRVQEVVKGGQGFASLTALNQFRSDMGKKYKTEYSYEWPSDVQNELLRLKALADNPPEVTKYENYVLPGGKNYRELLLTQPGKWTEAIHDEYSKLVAEKISRQSVAKEDLSPEKQQRLEELAAKKKASFRSGHFDEPDILAHIRFNERTGAGGEKILHLEEVQSDWHQAGRSKGYAAEGGKIPDAPFKKTWHELAFRRALRHAAENGFDRLTWTTGEQQAGRYDLSKKLDSMSYEYRDGQYHITGEPKGGESQDFGTFREAQLEDAIGKEMAEKIRAQRAEGKNSATFNGDGLKIGGEGMRGFYDKILPNYAEKFGKKFGAKVENATLKTRDMEFSKFEAQHKKMYPKATPEEIERAFSNYTMPETVHSLPITDAMRDALLYEGQPLFQGEKGAVSFLADGRALIHALEAPDFSTVVHELGHIFRRDLARPELAQLETWLLSKVPGSKWEVADEEKFARAFERYLAEGKAPDESLKPVFDKFRTWLMEIYQRITGTAIDVQLSPQVRAVFDRMLFTQALKAEVSPDVTRARTRVQADMAEMVDDLHRDLDLPVEAPAVRQAPPLTLPEGPDAVAGFLRAPENVGKALADVLEAEATSLENSRAETMAADGQALSGMVSDAPQWYIEANRSMRGSGAAMGKKSVVNALRSAARGDFARLTEGQQQMALAGIDAVGRQLQGEARSIDAQDLKIGDRYTTADLGQRVVIGERDGTLYLDNGRTLDLAETVKILGEIDRKALAEGGPQSAAEHYLAEGGDIKMETGTDSEGNPIQRSAREMLNESRAELAKTETQEYLYKRAAFCLQMG
jgi:hypothetical protein